MRAYLQLLRKVLTEGERREDRTGVGTLSLFGEQVKYDLRAGFPLVTTKKVNFDAVVRELLWFLSGDTNSKTLEAQGVNIWKAWADEDGDLGPIYGHQWRNWGADFSWGGVDQIVNLLDNLKMNPHSRRHIVSAWNVEQLPDMKLPPCHLLQHYYVSSDAKYLDLQLYQRSADMAVGVPFNIASYALLLTMIAQECGYAPRYFIHTLGDAHIYLNHVEGVEEQLRRAHLTYQLPRVEIAKKPVLDVKFEDIKLVNYQCHPFIKFPVAV